MIPFNLLHTTVLRWIARASFGRRLAFRTMSSLDLKTVDTPGEDPRGDKIFTLLRDFLQPGTTLTLKSASEAVLLLLPENAPQSSEVWNFGETCIEVAEQIPYHHPAHLKLAALLESLTTSTRLVQRNEVKGTNSGQYTKYQRLSESLRDNWMGPDPENPRAWVNFHAFAANIWERRVTPTDPTWAIWAQRDAHEGEETWDEKTPEIRAAKVLAAAQWILWYGQSFFKLVQYPGDVAPLDLQHWKPGPLYKGKAHLSLDRWHFWRDGFAAVASAETEKKGLVHECKVGAAKAAAMMDSLERNMTF